MLLSSGEITPPCGTPCFPLALSMTFSRCMTSASSTRWATFAKQPIMPDIVEIAAQVDVDDARLVLTDRSRHTVHRFMSCPLRSVSERPRLEVRLEDRFQYELERTLRHPVADRRNRKDADLAAILRDFLPPGRQRRIGAPDQFVR